MPFASAIEPLARYAISKPVNASSTRNGIPAFFGSFPLGVEVVICPGREVGAHCPPVIPYKLLLITIVTTLSFLSAACMVSAIPIE